MTATFTRLTADGRLVLLRVTRYAADPSNLIPNANAVYGTFASVIALVTWLSLHALVALVGAELNHALPARRYK